MSFVDKLLPKDKKSEYFLTLKVGIHSLYALVWEVKENKIIIIGRGEEVFDEADDEIQAADKAIAEAEKALPEGLVVEKVIFGLPLDFIQDEKITPPILAKLKKLTQRLSLTPLGFIELPQALAHFFKTKENAPTSAILLGINKKRLTVSLLRVGKIFENTTIERGENFSLDVEKVIKNLTQAEVLPSRILLYDENENLDALREELIKHPWHTKSTFLHFPKIEVVSKDDLLHALVESAAGQIIKTVNTDDFTPDEKSEEPVLDTPSVVPVVEEIKSETEVDSLGFMKGKDVIEEERKESSRKTSHIFVKEESPPSPHIGRPKFSLSLPRPKLPDIRFPSFGRLKFLRVVIVLFILLLAGGGVYAYWTVPKAGIRLIVATETMQKDMDITLSPNTTSVDQANLTLPATYVETEVSGDKSATTTGKKNIGNPAKGTVTLYNKTTSSKTFSSGTVLLANSLKFTLNSETIIASASDTGEGLTYGKTDVKITASSIGPSSNLSGGNTFSFADFPSSSYSGKNTDALSGGSSRQVSSVSKADQDNLLTELSEELKEKAKSSLLEKIDTKEKLLDESMKLDFTNKKFDKGVDSEGSTLFLSLNAKITGLTYKIDDFNTLIKDTLVTNTPPEFQFSSDNTTFKVHDVTTQKDDSLKLATTVSSKLLPKIPLEEIRKELIGKSLSQAQDYLKRQKNIMGVEIAIDSPFPFGKDTLPYTLTNINLSIASR